MTYALRTFRSARVFAATAVLTLALGIGGTTAIFTLMHAVMLKSLPVTDPSRLYRIGDGDNCCVQGSPQGRWGFFTFQLFERIKAETPQFQEITAFTTFVGRMSVRRQGVAEAPRPLRTMYATGSYFTTMGVSAFAGRLFNAADDHAGAPPVVVMAYHAWQGLYGGDDSVVGSTLVIEGHPFTVAGIGPPGFFGETLRADPAELWLPLQHETMIVGAETSLLRQGLSSWLRVIGRLRPDATTDGMDARLTTLLRQWIKTEAGYPANWMKEIERTLPEQVIAVVPAGAGVGVMKEQYGAVCGFCWRCARWCSSSPARTSPICCSRAPWHGAVRSPCGWLSARRASRSSSRHSSKASCWPCAAPSSGSWSRWVPPDCCSPSRLPARRRCPSTSFLHCRCWPLPLAWRWSPVCSLAPRRRGLPHGPIRSRRCVARAAQRATGRRSPARRCSWSRPRSRWYSSPDR